MKKPRAIIFDLDGTLADTLRDIAEAGNTAFASAGLAPRALAEYRGAVGSGVNVLLQRLSGIDDRERVAEMERVFREYYHEHCLDYTRLYPGVSEFLDAIGRAGLPMCVLSNKPHEYTVKTVEALCGERRFLEVRGEGNGFARKPDAACALHLAGRMGRSPGETVFVGDSDIDMHTAQNAGMRAVGVTWGFRDREVIEAAGAHAIIDHPNELLPLIGLDAV